MAELIADNLVEEAGSGSPKMGVVEHFLRVGRWLAIIASKFIKEVVFKLGYEVLTDPTAALARMENVATAIAHLLSKLF